MKKTSVRRGLAWILVLVMLLSAVPFGVLAEGAEGTAEENLEAPAPEGTPAGDQEHQETPEAPKTSENPEGEETPEGGVETPEKPEGKTGEAQKTVNAPATQEGTNGPIDQKDNQEDDTSKCVCDENGDKCTEEKHNEDCPVCSKDGADFKDCKGGKKVDDKPAAEDPDDSPASGPKTDGNTSDKPATGNGDDETKDETKDENGGTAGGANDTNNEPAAGGKNGTTNDNPEGGNNGSANSDQQPGTNADAQTGDQEDSITFTYKEDPRPNGIPETIGKLTAEWNSTAFYTEWENYNSGKPLPFGTNYVLRGVWSIETSSEVANTYLLMLTWGKEKGEQFTQINDGDLDCKPIMALNEETIFTLKVPSESQGLHKSLTFTTNSALNTAEFDGDYLKFVGLSSLNYGVRVVVYNPATVTFHANADGATNVTLPKDITSFRTGTVDLSEQKATRPGYIFKGWSTSDGADAAEKKVTSLTMDADNIDLYAVWEQVDIKLTGDGVTEQIVHPNSEGMLDKQWFELTREGYVFRGWKDEDGNIVPENKVYEQNTTLTAFWVNVKTSDNVFSVLPLTKEHGDILLGSSYHTGDQVEIETRYASGTELSYLSEKGREKLNTKDSRGVFYFSIKVWKYTGDRTQASDTGKTMWFDLTDFWKDFGGQMVIVREHKVTGQQTEIQYITQKDPAALEDGVTEGWCWKDGKLYLVARYFSNFAMVAACPVVSFDSQGGTACADAEVGIGGTLDSLPTPTRTGYTFDGWYLTKDCTGTKLDTNHVYHADTTVYAKWNPWNYTVIFDGNGGKVKNSVKTSETVSAVYGSEVTAPEFVKEYYTVSAWARNADGTEKVESPIKDLAASDGERITLYAQWEYAPRTVSFDANGVDNNGKATKGTVTEDGTEKASVTRKTQESPINTLKTVPVPNAQEGYYFEGWYYKDKANKEQPVEIGKTEFTADTTVYAKWKVFEPVTVTLKCQRGTMTVDGKSVSQGTMQTKWPGVLDGTLPTPARTGYKFQGWYTYAGVKVDENTVFLRDTTIYARWTSAVSRTGNPKTGDQIALEAAVAVLVVAAVGLGAAVIIKKKQNKK